jgi:glutamate-1-semialdehyde 2,1-aminomutase
MAEPVMCNTGVIPPEPGFLEGLRRICDRYGALLYFDETITGFRLGLQGAQGRYNVRPDLASFAKAMAGGIANAALVGRRQYMARFADDVNHSGTFNSNVLSMAASAAAIAELEKDDGAAYRTLDTVGSNLIQGICELGKRHGLPVHVQGMPAAFHMSFTDLPAIRDYRDYALHCDKARYSDFVIAMLKRGVRLIGRGIWYVSTAHTQEHVDRTLAAVDSALGEIRG